MAPESVEAAFLCTEMKTVMHLGLNLSTLKHIEGLLLL